ncbi:MAG: EAL domain-containing protein [Alphaproteobacteria bacterium]
MSLDQLTRIALPDGAVVFRIGDAGDCAFIIEKGRIEITLPRGDAGNRTFTLGPGELFGEMALIDDQPRLATARSVGETELLTVTRDQLQRRLDNTDSVVAMLLRLTLARYRAFAREMAPEPPRPRATKDETDGHDGARTSGMGRMRLENDLRSALERGEFRLAFQPIVTLSNNKLAGFEALIRWQSPERGFVSPDQFIGVAEESGIIQPIGRWVAAEACRGLHRIEAARRHAGVANGPLFCSINVTKQQMTDEGFFGAVAAALDATGIAASQIKMELTESMLIDDQRLALNWIGVCKDRGHKVSIDDFGTGFSSLGYLQHFPIDEIKIDRSFIRAMLENSKSMAIVRAVIGLAHGLGLQTVAEGVEIAAHATALDDSGCQYGQGYHFAKPASADEVLARLTAPAPA